MDFINEYLNCESAVLAKLSRDDIVAVFNVLLDALKNNKTIYVFGNGGSAATASHFQNDFNRAQFVKIDKQFNFICLNDNIPTMLAIANDIGYDEVFKYQLLNKVKSEDIIIAISGSGNSKNIISAVNYAKLKGATIIGFTGYNGGKLRKLADYSLDTNINNMEMTEDVHMCFEHLLISYFYKKFGRGKYKKDE